MLTNSDKIIEPFTNLVNNLADNYYDKEEINQLISQTGGFIVVEQLPTEDIQRNLIYLKGPIGELRDKYEEWIYTGTPGTRTLIGDTTIDLTDYATKDFCKKTYYPLAGGVFATTVTVGPDNSNISNGFLHRRAFPAGTTGIVTGSLNNGAAFGVKLDGTASFQHKTYANGKFGGAKNTAVMTFSGATGLKFAINTGSGSDVTPDMYHDVLVDQTNYFSLQTEAKDIIGAINEVNAKPSGGGSYSDAMGRYFAHNYTHQWRGADYESASLAESSIEGDLESHFFVLYIGQVDGSGAWSNPTIIPAKVVKDNPLGREGLGMYNSSGTPFRKCIINYESGSFNMYLGGVSIIEFY